MNTTTRLLTTLSLTSCLLLSSCAEVANVLENTGGMAAMGGALGGIIGASTGHGNRHQRAMVGGLIGAGAGAAASLIYKASLKQRSDAQARANYALTQNRSIMKSVKSSGATHLAVPVKRDTSDSRSKSGVVRVKIKKKSDGTMEAGSTDSTLYDADSPEATRNAVFYQP